MPASYTINVKGRLGDEMLHLLADLRPDVQDGITVLHTDNTDQASLHGVLLRIRNLGLSIDAMWTADS